ncbi:MAG TPA: HIT domain-containing protein [Herpetosiphonaceae bacterium]|nr:HIT domain-containing protein [Herpetosiphonaceae bacterium]
MNDCIFCQIVAGAAPAYVIGQDDRVIVFLSLENHPLIVPRAHIPDLYALPAGLGAAVMEWSVLIAVAVKRALGCEGIYVTQANGAAANQDVFHYHMHIYPRWFDAARSARYATAASAERKQRTLDLIRQALNRG